MVSSYARRFRLDSRSNFFLGKVVKHWNKLLGKAMEFIDGAVGRGEGCT